MKRILLISVLMVLVLSISFSQMAYKKGDQVVNLGLGIGGLAGAYGTGSIAITGGYEYGVTENISLGGVVGYSSSSETIYGDYGWKYTYIIIPISTLMVEFYWVITSFHQKQLVHFHILVTIVRVLLQVFLSMVFLLVAAIISTRNGQSRQNWDTVLEY